MSNNPRLLQFVLWLLFPVISFQAWADDGESYKQELSKEEIDSHIGRYGEPEPIPKDFRFTEAETKLWLDDHLNNVDRPVRLYYEFIKSGTYEPGFTDAVYLDIIKINEDGTKNAILDFFTAERKQNINTDNVTNISGNPVLGVYMQGDIYEMYRLTEGHWRHFQKRIKIALRENAIIAPVTFHFNGKEIQGEKITFSPYLKDPHRRDFEKFADKDYEFILSDEIPGRLFQIKTVIHDQAAAEPLIEETLTLVEAKFSQ